MTKIINQDFAPGIHSINFNADGLPSGTYFYLMEAVSENGKSFSETKKMSLIK
jgi:hypothetical protein